MSIKDLRICGICGFDLSVTDLRDHLRERHPGVTPTFYEAEFPDPKTIPVLVPPPEDFAEGVPAVLGAPRLPSVTDEEAAAHPGGREAAQIEKTIELEERKAYREDVEALLATGYPPSFEVATTAYNMLQVRRSRLTIEMSRTSSGERFIDTDNLDLLAALENRVREGIKLLERIKSEIIKNRPVDDPSVLIDRELLSAERWIQDHIGEFTERCQKCGDLITPPNLPHWAFERIDTVHGPAWPVWSRELWELVLEKAIEMWVMAYILRTSIEGLQQTCERRGDPWPEINLNEQEAKLNKRLRANDRRALISGVTA